MLELLKTYREESISELLKIYMKGCILKEYFFIFPFLTKISFRDDQFYKFLSNKLKLTYYQPISVFLTNEEQFFTICKEAWSEIQNALYELQTGRVYDLVKDFPNIAFPKYTTEPEVLTIWNGSEDESGDENRYEDNNFFIEYYIRLEDSTLSEARDQSEIDFLNRPNKYRGVVNIDVFNTWIDSITMPQDRFLALIRNRYLGVRLIYIPTFNLDETGRRQLYQSVITDPKVVLEKTNALAFADTGFDIKYKFPLVVAKQEALFPPNLGSLVAMQNYVDNTVTFDNDVYNLTNDLWKDLNFSKLFNYHFPVKMLQAILYSNFVERYDILRDVLIENKVFQDLSGTIINLLTRIKFAEDPTNI